MAIFKEKDRMVSVGLACCNMGAEGAGAVADYVSVSASLTLVSAPPELQPSASLSMPMCHSMCHSDLSPTCICCVHGSHALSTFVQLDLEENILGSDGGKAIGKALEVNASLTSIGEGGLKLKYNNLRDEGWGAIFAGVCANKESKIASINASKERIGPEGGQLIGEALRTCVSASLTKLEHVFTREMPPHMEHATCACGVFYTRASPITSSCCVRTA